MAACEEDARTVFLKIQEANNVLSNEAKRRAYDSQLDFDESVPTEEETREASRQGIDAFVQLYDPVFKRNARFAANKPVPGIGNSESTIQQVQRFYDYWINFDSWRDFTNVSAEHNVDSATSREEKRWMIKENERGAKKLKKKEMARITDMTMRAMEWDPRLIAEKERVRQQKQAARTARDQQKAEEAAAIAQKQAEAEAEIEAEKERQRLQKLEWEKRKKQASRTRNTFRKLLRACANAGADANSSEYGPISADEVDLLCQQLDMSQITSLNDCMGGESALQDPTSLIVDYTDLLQALSTVRQRMEEIAKEEELALEERRKQETARANTAELKKKGLNREWSREDLSTLSKAIGKFPGGMKQRWVAVCNYMNDILKPAEPFTRDECMKAAHNAMEHLAAMKESGGIGVGFKKMGISGAAATPAPSSPLPAPPSKVTIASAIPPGAPVPALSGTAPKGKASAGEAASVWTQEQQQQLEDGLKQFPASMDKAERWTNIAAGVTGKTRKDCINRYKQLKEELQTKSSGS